MNRDDTLQRPWIETLQRFVADLRLRGLTVSQAELVDAARAATEVGPEGRLQLRAALSMTLAKDLRSQEIFADAFDLYFAPPSRSADGKGRGERGGAGEGDGRGGSGGSGPSSALARRPTDEDPPTAPGISSRRPPDSSRTSRRGLRPLDRREIQKTLDSRAKPREGNSRKEGTMRRLDHARVQDRSVGGQPKTRDQARQRHDGNEPRARLTPDRAREASVAPSSRLRRVLAYERGDDIHFEAKSRAHDGMEQRRLDLTMPLTMEEEKRLGEEIPRILQELRLRRGRRKRRAARGRIWMKRVIRESLSAGGVPFDLPVYERVPRPPRIALVVDVSHSVARAAGLFLRLALEMLELDRQTRVFLFVNHPVEGTEPLRIWLRGRRGNVPVSKPDARHRASPATPDGPRGSPRIPRTTSGAGGLSRLSHRGFAHRSRGSRPGESILSSVTGRSFLDALQEIPGLDIEAPSDYGRAFYALTSGPLHRLRRNTVLVVLGDGRTNVYDPLPWAFEEIAARAKRVIWLVPENRRRWGTGDSALPLYLRFCDVAIEVTDLEGLAHGVRELVASL